MTCPHDWFFSIPCPKCHPPEPEPLTPTWYPGQREISAEQRKAEYARDELERENKQ